VIGAGVTLFGFEPFGSHRRFHYRLTYHGDQLQPNTYNVNVVRDGGRWRVCDFFYLSRNFDKPGELSGFQNW